MPTSPPNYATKRTDYEPKHRRPDVAGSYFTRPKGLHPTPSACYPPPPKKKLDGIKILFWNPEPTQHVGLNTTWNISPQNPNEPVFAGVVVELTMATMFDHDTKNVRNYGEEGWSVAPPGPPGNYIATVKATWQNGQTRTQHFPVVIYP